MKVIQNNAVEMFLKNNPNKIYSLKTLKHKLNLSKKYTFFLAMNSKKIRKVNPLEVGSCKIKLSAFKYDDVPDIVCDIKIVDVNDNIIDNNLCETNLTNNKEVEAVEEVEKGDEVDEVENVDEVEKVLKVEDVKEVEEVEPDKADEHDVEIIERVESDEDIEIINKE